MRYTLRSVQLLMLAVLTLVATSTLHGTASAGPGPFYWIINQHSGKALMPLNDSKDHGVEIIQMTLAGNRGAQNWKVRIAGEIDGVNRIRLFENRHSKYCISAGSAQPIVLRQVQCQNWTWHEEWVVSNYNDMWAGRWVTFWNRYSGLCMDVQAASTADYARVGQWPCHGGANQRFRLSHVPGT